MGTGTAVVAVVAVDAAEIADVGQPGRGPGAVPDARRQTRSAPAAPAQPAAPAAPLPEIGPDGPNGNVLYAWDPLHARNDGACRAAAPDRSRVEASSTAGNLVFLERERPPACLKRGHR